MLFIFVVVVVSVFFYVVSMLLFLCCCFFVIVSVLYMPCLAAMPYALYTRASFLTTCACAVHDDGSLFHISSLYLYTDIRFLFLLRFHNKLQLR